MCGLIAGYLALLVGSRFAKKMGHLQYWLEILWNLMGVLGTSRRLIRTSFLLMPRRCGTYLWVELGRTFGHGRANDMVITQFGQPIELLQKRRHMIEIFDLGDHLTQQETITPFGRNLGPQKFPLRSGFSGGE
jgi:hypothetical protein